MFTDDVFGQMFGGNVGGMGGLGGFFGGGLGGGRRRGPARGEDTVHRLKVSLEDLYSGKVSKLQLSKNTICPGCEGQGGHGAMIPCEPCHGRGIQITVSQIGPGMVQQMQSKCSHCSGEGETMASGDRCKTCSGRKTVPDTKLLEVNVEPGMRDEQKIVFRGEGDQVPGVEPGNVLIVLQEKPHKDFKRDGCDLFIRKTVSLTEALCGFTSTITHLDGRVLTINNPPGAVLKPNSVRGVVNEGMPIYQQPNEKGDLYVQFSVDFPASYFADEPKLLKLEALLGGRPMQEPIPEDAEEVNLTEAQVRSSRDNDDDEDGPHGHGPQMQCAHQ